MSLATLAAPMAATADRPSDGPEFMSLAAASRLTRLHPTTLQRLALAGNIRTKVRGLRTVYNAGDVRRFAE